MESLVLRVLDRSGMVRSDSVLVTVQKLLSMNRPRGHCLDHLHGQPLDLNRPDSTFMNHRGAVYATDENLARCIRRILAQTE